MQSLWMLVSGLCFAVMGVFVKVGAAHFSVAVQLAPASKAEPPVPVTND